MSFYAQQSRRHSVANNLGTTSDSWERQVEAGAFGVPQDLGKLRGHARRRARPARRAGEKDGSWKESKRARLNGSSPTGRDDRTEGGEEMSARRMPQWACRPPGKVSIPMGRKHVAGIERQMAAYNNAL